MDLTVSAYSQSFFQALLDDVQLAACRKELDLAGFPPTVGMGVHFFVPAAKADDALKHLITYGICFEAQVGEPLSLFELRHSCVIIGEEFLPILGEAIRGYCKSKENVRPKKCSRFRIGVQKPALPCENISFSPFLDDLKAS